MFEPQHVILYYYCFGCFSVLFTCSQDPVCEEDRGFQHETEILHHSATRRSKEKNTDTEAAAPCLKVCHRKARKLNKHNRCNKHKTRKLVLKT